MDEGLTTEVVQSMSDAAIESSRAVIQSESARRANLAMIPAQIWELEDQFLAEGGDPAELVRPVVEGEEDDSV